MERHATEESACQSQALLKHGGLRPTFARLAIIETLQGSPTCCMTAEHIQAALTRQNRPMSMGTICRCLNCMESRGIVTRERDRTGEASKAGYLLVAPWSATGVCRFYCRCCGKVAEVIDAALSSALQEHARTLDFLPFAEALRVDSLCVACAGFSEID